MTALIPPNRQTEPVQAETGLAGDLVIG